MGGLFKEAVDVGSTVGWKAGGMSVTHPECCGQPGGYADVTLRALAQGKGWSLHAEGGFCLQSIWADHLRSLRVGRGIAISPKENRYLSGGGSQEPGHVGDMSLERNTQQAERLPPCLPAGHRDHQHCHPDGADCGHSRQGHCYRGDWPCPGCV